jgi:outer membrane lipoprotein-sorting protein
MGASIAFLTLAASAGAGAGAATARTNTWHDIVQPGFQDCTFVARAVRADQGQLRKINSDFAASYRFLGTQVKGELKDPFMLRLDSEVEDTIVSYVENDDRRMFRIPRSRLEKKEDLSNSPGKRQTLMYFGILTPSLFERLYDATFIRDDRETGNEVFDLTFKHPEYADTTRQRIWVDSQRLYITKRVWFAQDGHEMATFLYENPQLQNGIWFPTKMTVKNVDDVVAGITEYSHLNVNTGLTTRPFQF